MSVNIPANPLVQDHPADTLDRCAKVLAVLEGVRPTEVGTDEDVEGIGLATIHKVIRDALSYEAERVTARTG